jgi:hypothetical protein
MVEFWGGSEGLVGQSDVGEDGDDMVDAVDAKDSWRRQESSSCYGGPIIMVRVFEDSIKVRDGRWCIACMHGMIVWSMTMGGVRIGETTAQM